MGLTTDHHFSLAGTCKVCSFDHKNSQRDGIRWKENNKKMSFTRRRVSKIWRRLSSICSSPPLPSLSNDGFLINLLPGRHYLSAFDTRFSRAFILTSELALSPRSPHTQFRYIGNLCEVLVLSVYVSAHRMLVTGQWQLRFLMEPICQTQSIVEPRFSLVKIKQLRFAYLKGSIFYSSDSVEKKP